MISALEDEICAQDEPPHSVPAGVLQDTPATPEQWIYRFAVHPPRWASEGDSVVCRLGDFVHSATVHGTSDTWMTIAFKHDLGPTTEPGDIVPDGAWMLVSLQQSLRRAAATPQRVAHALPVLGVAAMPRAQRVEPAGGWPACVDDLTEEQRDAIALTLGSPVALLWGPPGTGKTTTVSGGVVLHVEAGRRVLLVAPTNTAADAALIRVAERLEADPRFAHGLVLRVGDRVSPELRARFGDRVVFKDVLARVLAERAAAVTVARVALEHAQTALDAVTRQVRAGAAAGAVASHSQRADELEVLRTRVAVLSRKVDEAVRRAAKQRVADELLANAMVVGTTVHHAFLSRRLAGVTRPWDVVVIDEAGMVPLAMAYACCTLAAPHGRMWLAGDPLQLPPVVRAATPVAHRWLARDVFAATRALARDANDHIVTAPWIAAITEQFRMPADVCRLVDLAYGRLRTAPCVARRPAPPLLPFGTRMGRRTTSRLLLLDTTGLGATVTRDHTGSRANAVHAAIVGDVLTLLEHHGVLPPSAHGIPGVGLISPFRAQARLLRQVARQRVSAARRADVVASTVHKYQGREVSLVIVDLTDGAGLRLSRWLQAPTWDAPGARLLTVALSRPRVAALILADVEALLYALRGVPGRPPLGRLLSYAAEFATGVDVHTEIQLAAAAIHASRAAAR